MISFPRKKSKKYKDNRCRRIIKQALNKRFRNKSAVNNDIAKIILFLADAQQSDKLTGSILPVYSNE